MTGLTITGVLGESNRLLDSERESLIVTAVRAAEATGTPVCVGAHACISLFHHPVSMLPAIPRKKMRAHLCIAHASLRMSNLESAGMGQEPATLAPTQPWH